MRVYYSPRYHINIGAHVFPTIKYSRLAARLQTETGPGLHFIEPESASWEDLALVHTPYQKKLQLGDFSIEELALLEVPWSPEVVEGFRLMTGGTVQAARDAIGGEFKPVVAHLGGGLHHAFPNHGDVFFVP